MSDNQRHTIIRFAAIFILLLLGFIAVWIKIIIVQVKDRDELMAIIDKKESKDEIVYAERGKIFDSSNNLIAGSAPSYRIYMDTRTDALRKNDGELFKKNLDTTAYCLSQIFGDRTQAEYKREMVKAYQTYAGRWKIYDKRINYSQMQAIKRIPLFSLSRYKSGLIVEEGHRRIKPFGSLASRSIGNIYGDNGQGTAGIELGFEDYLRGENGKRILQMVNGRIVAQENEDPQNGQDVVTTLDMNLQDIVETQLRQTLQQLDADWGTCVLMETRTGKIRAISNLGKHTTASGTNYIEDRNYALNRIEPGSTFKTYSLMAALDDGKIEVTDTIDVERGLWYYEKAQRPIRDSHTYKDKNGQPLQTTRFTVKQVLATSSNVGLAKIVTSSYEKKASKFVDKLRSMGISEQVGFEIPGKDMPRIDIPNDNETLARMAFGYYVELCPLDVLMFYNAIANNGKMIRPYIVEEIRESGKTITRFGTETVKQSVCKSSTLRDVRECLEAVVWDNEFGTASVNPWGSKKAQSNIVHIAGKTGTAQIFKDGHYLNYQHRTLFCGYFPMERPEYTCICVIQQKPHAIYDAGMNCGGTVRRIAEKTMAYRGGSSVKQHYQSPDSLLLPPIKRGNQHDIHIAARGTKVKVKMSDSEWVRINEEYEAIPIPIVDGLVPNVVGMGARDAVYAIERTGMLVRLNGKGKVVSQSVAAGTRVSKGGTITLELK